MRCGMVRREKGRRRVDGEMCIFVFFFWERDETSVEFCGWVGWWQLSIWNFGDGWRDGNGDGDKYIYCWESTGLLDLGGATLYLL